MITEAQKRATSKYVKENYKRIPLDVKKSDYVLIKDMADKKGCSINGFIKETVFEAIEKNKNKNGKEMVDSKKEIFFSKNKNQGLLSSISEEQLSIIEIAANKLNCSIDEFILDTVLDRIDSLKGYFLETREYN